MVIELRHVRDELVNVVERYPVWPGDTISHETARMCSDLGWIVRQADGCWIPTWKGLIAYAEAVR